MNQDFAAMFRFPKSRGQGDFTIKYMEAAFDKQAGSGEFFLEFEEKVWEHKLIECFEAQGAGQVNTITFATNDGNESASNALVRVLASQEKTNLKFSYGTCTDPLRCKVQAKLAQCCQKCGATILKKRSFDGCAVDSEYDFIKKRKEIQDELDYSGEGSVESEESLIDFIDFNEAVNSAFEHISTKDISIGQEEREWVDKNATSCTKRKFGYVYAAFNPCFEELIKIGATMKDTPFERLKQLSGTNVPKCFELIACIPSFRPFLLEKKAHAYFKNKRIRKGGRLTEFFKIDKKTISDYMNTLLCEQLVDDE